MPKLAHIPPPGLEHEASFWAAGLPLVAGADEAGRGAWAGPVVAAAVILPAAPGIAAALAGVADSKLLTPARREALFDVILRYAVSYGVGAVPAEEIDRIGILPATRAAMLAAIAALRPQPQALLIDAVRLPASPLPQQALIKGDRLCLSIAAASIIAKVTRDRWMVELDRRQPGYGLARHKGYGTPAHWAALQLLGPSPVHRRSFAPVARLLAERSAGNG